MKVPEKNVMRLVAVQHLRTAYGIKTKNWNKNKAASCKSTASSSMKVFGVPLEGLPYYNMECGSVPSFLVDACMKLLAHVDTEGLFRKSGSIVRLKGLRAKLDAGEECLSDALPCDVACLVKQFFRELPEPVLPIELQEAFLKAQQLPAEEDRTSATILLSCVLPDKNLTALRYFFGFLHNVSKRSAENKMDSSNLSVILAPNLLHFGDGTEKINANTEKRLKLQATVVHCFIENAHSFGALPQFLQEKVPAMMGCESGAVSPTHDEGEDLDLNSGMKKRHRRSIGDVVNGALNKIKTNRTPTRASQSDNLVFSSATPVIATPSSKRKLPLESGHSFGFSNKKRRSVKKSIGMDLLPNTLFNGTSTPGSAVSASGALDSSENILSSAGRSRRQSFTSVRRKSRRLSKRNAINRVESGRAGCFSPKVSKKEAPRKSLRLRFSLGKGSKDAGSGSIGWRLATQESTTSFCFTKETDFSPSGLPRKAESKGSKYISKSEDNLLTPKCDASWRGETPIGAHSRGSFTDTPLNTCLKSSYASEPAIMPSKPPASASLPKKLCCASSADSLESSITEAQSPTRINLLKTAFTEPESNILDVAQDASARNTTKTSDSTAVPPQGTPADSVLSVDASTCQAEQRFRARDQNIIFSQTQIAPLSPLHIDSVIFESSVYCSPPTKAKGSPSAVGSSHNSPMGTDGEQEAEQMNHSRLIDALDIQSPSLFKLGVSSGVQSTPYKLVAEHSEELIIPPKTNSVVSATDEKSAAYPEMSSQAQNQQPAPPSDCSQETEKGCVAEHIQHFNMLTLHSPRNTRTAQLRSPLQFQRTPVRQTVRRINSMLDDSRRPRRNTAGQSSQVVKAVSLESGLSPHPQPQPHQSEAQAELSNSNCPVKKPPPVLPKRASTLARKAKASALGDVTNKVQPKSRVDSSVSDPAGAPKPPPLQLVEKDRTHYRGSPRNPLNQGRLLSATKPVDL